MKEVFAVINSMVTAGVVESYALGGAMAAAAYIEAVSTEDIDIFVHISPPPPRFMELNSVYEYLNEYGYKPKNEFVELSRTQVSFTSSASMCG